MENERKKISVISQISFVMQTPHQRNQYLAGFLATMVMFIAGNFIGWSSPVGIKLQEHETPFECTDGDWAWAASFMTLGGVPWSVFAGTFADIIGRRLTLLLSGPIFILGWILTYFSYRCYTLFAARLIAGGGLAIGTTVGALYIGEICEPDIRGRIGALIMFMHNFGVLFSMCIGPYVSYKTFIYILVVIPFIFLITFYWMPETPYYRLKQGRRDEAMKCLLKFRGLTEDKQLENELETMKRGVDSEMENKTSILELVKNPLCRRGLIIALGVKTMQQFSGVVAIQSYMAEIFEETDSFIPASIAAIVCTTVQLISGIFASAFVDRFGRKPLLLFSACGTAVALFSVGLYFFLQNYIECDVSSINWLPLVSIIFFMIAQPIGVGTLAYVFISEIFPTNSKANASMIATMYGALAATIVTKLFSVISNSLDMFVTFWLCCLIMLGGIIFTIFFIPETKAAITMFMSGTVVGWASPVQMKLKNDETPFECTEDGWGWVVSIYSLGTLPWCIFAGTFADTIGRRLTMLFAGPLYLISWILTYFSNSCYTLIFARFIAGGGAAIASAVCALYIGEICEPAIRGRVGALIMIMHHSGSLFSLSVGPYVSYKTFIYILSTIPFIFLITFYWMPETPYYRLRQGRRDEAMKCLLKFRGLTDDKQLEQELETMKRGVDSEMQNKTTVIELFKDPITRKAMVLLIGVKTMQHFSGIGPITGYMQYIFEETDSFIPPSFAAIVCGTVQLFTGFCSSFFVDRFGRKPLLLGSCSGTALALFSVGLYFFLQNYIECDVSAINWLPLVSIMFFMVAQPIGVGTLSYIFLSEIFPTNLRGTAAQVGTMYGALAGFTVTKLFSVISEALDMFVTFWLCSIVMICSIIFTLFYVFETKGKSLLQIQNELSNKQKNCIEVNA